MKPLRLALLAAALALNAWTPVAWSWEPPPEGTPYSAEEVSLPLNASRRDDLVFRQGTLAWTDRVPLPQLDNPHNGRVAYRSLDGSRQGNVNESGAAAIPRSYPAYLPALGRNHLAWVYDGNATGVGPSGGWNNPYVGNEVYLLDLETQALTRLAGNASLRATPPHIAGDFLVWTMGEANTRESHPVIHRLNLATSQAESWRSPINWTSDNPMCELPAWPAGSRILLFVDANCVYGERRGGLYLWDPATNRTTPVHVSPAMTGTIPGQPVPNIALDGDRFVYVATPTVDPVSWHIYVYDLRLDVQTQATFLPGGSSDFPILSGDLVAWMDLRAGGPSVCSSDGTGCAQPASTHVYFKNLTSANEYKLTGSGGTYGRIGLDGNLLAYNDANDLLVVKRLPGPEKVLVTTVATSLEPATNGTATLLNLSLVPSVAPSARPVALRTQVWDTNLDGVFEASGSLRLPLNGSRAPDLARAAGIAVATDGRFSLVEVSVPEAHAAALSPKSPTPAVSSSSPAAGTTPGLGAIAVVAALGFAIASVKGRIA